MQVSDTRFVVLISSAAEGSCFLGWDAVLLDSITF
jgi:hypothetical protein